MRNISPDSTGPLNFLETSIVPDLKLCRSEPRRLRPCDGTWTMLVAWFSEFVNHLDRGDLIGAKRCQEEIERHGFKISFRRLPGHRKSRSKA